MKQKKLHEKQRVNVSLIVIILFIAIACGALINAIQKDVVWKIVCSSLGCVGFIFLAILHIRELKNFNK